jgi:methionyl-tRNA synthetase
MKAKKRRDTLQVIDKYDIIRKSFIDFDISDNYSRTSAKNIMIQLQSFYYQKGDFIEQVTEQLYDAKADQFLADRFVIGTCPNVAIKKLMAPMKTVVQP